MTCVIYTCVFLTTPQTRNRLRCALPIRKLVPGDFAAQLIYTVNMRLPAEQKRMENAGKGGCRGCTQLVCNERRGRGIYPDNDRRKSKGIRISASPACIHCASCVDKLRPSFSPFANILSSVSQFNLKKKFAPDKKIHLSSIYENKSTKES